MQRTDELLRRLGQAGLEFLVIGGVAAVAHGSSMATRDLDITAPFEPANLARLLVALEGVAPRHALTPDAPALEPSPERLAGYKNLYIRTDIGRVDVMGAEAAGEYAELRQRAALMDLGSGVCPVLGLEDLIAAKARLGRPKDRIVEAELRAIRDRLGHG